MATPRLGGALETSIGYFQLRADYTALVSDCQTNAVIVCAQMLSGSQGAGMAQAVSFSVSAERRITRCVMGLARHRRAVPEGRLSVAEDIRSTR